MDSLNKTFETDTYKNKTKIKKIKVESAEIVVHGTVEKPYYEIKYLVIGEDEYRIGYSSYDLKNVFGWLEECFEIVASSVSNPLQRSSVYMNHFNKEKLLHNLTCFGCEYKEDCEDDFEHGNSHCDEKYQDAVAFANENKVIF